MAPPTPATPVVTPPQVDGHDDGTRPRARSPPRSRTTSPPRRRRDGRSSLRPAVAPPASARAAALVTGAVVGVAGALLTLRSCGAATRSRHGILRRRPRAGAAGRHPRPDGGAGRRAAVAGGCRRPRGTSFLAVGALAVVALLTRRPEAVWMFLALPALGAPSYLLATGSPRPSSSRTPERGPSTTSADRRQRPRSRGAATSSAICTVLSAAPLRRLSLEMNSASPRSPSTPGSCRIRPTKLGVPRRPAAGSGRRTG